MFGLGAVVACASAGGADPARRVVPGDAFPVTLCLSYDAARTAALAEGRHRLALEVRRRVAQPSGGGSIEVSVLGPDGRPRRVGSAGLLVDGPAGGEPSVQRFQFALRHAPLAGGAGRLCFLIDHAQAPSQAPVALEIALSWLEFGTVP